MDEQKRPRFVVKFKTDSWTGIGAKQQQRYETDHLHEALFDLLEQREQGVKVTLVVRKDG